MTISKTCWRLFDGRLPLFQCPRNPDQNDQLRSLDKRDEGTIDVESFRRVMQNLGTAKLNSREVDAMLEVGGLEGNRLRYADWVGESDSCWLPRLTFFRSRQCCSSGQLVITCIHETSLRAEQIWSNGIRYPCQTSHARQSLGT